MSGFPELFYEDRKEDQLNLGPNGMSIDLLRQVYRNPSIPLPVRMRAAISCLPFETPKLAVTYQASESDFASLLDQRIKRYQEMKLIAHQPQPAVETRPPLPRVPDRRFRRI
jgi:hypothetical protein